MDVATMFMHSFIIYASTNNNPPITVMLWKNFCLNISCVTSQSGYIQNEFSKTFITT